MVANAAAQKVVAPPTPTDITPPCENLSSFLEGNAIGSQGYVCLPTSTGGPAGSHAKRQMYLDCRLQIITHFTSINANPNGVSSSGFSERRCDMGRVPSTAARCGQRRRDISTRARTR